MYKEIFLDKALINQAPTLWFGWMTNLNLIGGRDILLTDVDQRI